MKKISLWLLILTICMSIVVVFSFVGCKEEAAATEEEAVEEATSSEEAPAEEAAEVEVTEEKKVIGYASGGRTSMGFIAAEGFITKFSEEKGYDVVITNAEMDAVKQAQDIEDLIARGVDCIIALPIDSKAIISSIESAHKAGIPFVCNMRQEDPEAEEKSDAFCGQDTIAEAYDAAVALNDVLLEDGIEAEDVKVLHMVGDLKDENAVNRAEGFVKAADEFGWMIVNEIPTEWNPDLALNGATNALSADPDINVIMVASDYLWPAVKNALISQDKLFERGEEGHVYVVSQDLYPEAIQDIKAKLMDTNGIFDFELFSKASVEAADKLIKGEELEDSVILVKAGVATLKNIDELAETYWGRDYEDVELEG